FIKKEIYFASDLRGSHTTVESVDFVSPTVANEVDCLYDAIMILGAPTPEGQQTLVNTRILSTRYRHTLRFESGRWLVAEEQRLDDLGDGDLCPA
ncbi:MAG: hypothetical protein ABIQ39_10490, partial [Ilumatobacteraceae bacterium]